MRQFLIFLLCIFLIGCQNSIRKNESIKQTERQRFLDNINKKNAKATSHRNDDLYKLHINKKDSIISWPGICCDRYRVFGYENPDLKSKKVILISVFTDDVKGNPFELKFGAFHYLGDQNNFKLKFIENEKKFVKVNFIKFKKNHGTIYFEKKWAQFDEEE